MFWPYSFNPDHPDLRIDDPADQKLLVDRHDGQAWERFLSKLFDQEASFVPE
eukprot:CAMPEP_0174695394 /NCGR_PEP_ID=MMETSP1094-20130205/1769_1 /TAXON_ID=156173 /ORGANISM="Chrysochromulina brevifilum, Strain UTEX LB 985" /LENGTH=51 /DNA_ID=CAMNT_0015891875 /DNA_START=326 /DNA_END=481 /DNA_ORIENTATION=-